MARYEYDSSGDEALKARIDAVLTPPDVLSLLVIDLGDSVVVKVEKGDPETIFSKIIVSAYKDATAIISVPFSGFESVKASIEALDDAPVPRIERRDNRESPWLYQLFDCSGAKDNYLTSAEYAALSDLAGKPLPIYEGGKWEELNPPAKVGIGWELPFTAYRYSR